MEDERVIHEIRDEISSSLEQFGLPQIVSKAYLTLYFEGYKTQEELKKELKCSLSAISQALTFLEKTGMICVCDKKGRKKMYTTTQSFEKAKKNHVETFLRFHIDPMIEFLNTRGQQAKNPENKRKISDLRKHYQKTRSFIKLLHSTQGGP